MTFANNKYYNLKNNYLTIEIAQLIYKNLIFHFLNSASSKSIEHPFK